MGREPRWISSPLPYQLRLALRARDKSNLRYIKHHPDPQEQHALVLVGSRTGAVPAWVRLQPPPPRTARTDFPYAALLSASRHGLCDLSTRSAFGRSPIADPIVSEEPESVMEPRRTPPLPDYRVGYWAAPESAPGR